MNKRVIELKVQGPFCGLLAKKVPKKNTDFEFKIKILKITDFLIIGIGSEEVGIENSFLSQYFLGYSPLDGKLY